MINMGWYTQNNDCYKYKHGAAPFHLLPISCVICASRPQHLCSVLLFLIIGGRLGWRNRNLAKVEFEVNHGVKNLCSICISRSLNFFLFQLFMRYSKNWLGCRYTMGRGGWRNSITVSTRMNIVHEAYSWNFVLHLGYSLSLIHISEPTRPY